MERTLDERGPCLTNELLVFYSQPAVTLCFKLFRQIFAARLDHLALCHDVHVVELFQVAQDSSVVRDDYDTGASFYQFVIASATYFTELILNPESRFLSIAMFGFSTSICISS